MKEGVVADRPAVPLALNTLVSIGEGFDANAGGSLLPVDMEANEMALPIAVDARVDGVAYVELAATGACFTGVLYEDGSKSGGGTCFADMIVGVDCLANA